MQTKIQIALTGMLYCLLGISHDGHSQQKLKAAEFHEQLRKTPDALLIDVRTAKEISRSYLEGAIFLDFYDSSFSTMIQRLDTSRPVFVYCAIGGRSADAAMMLAKLGFKEVYDLRGGIINWKLAGLPVQNGKEYSPYAGMPVIAFEAMLDPQRLTLVDFYAPWCAPCRRMVPALEEMRLAMGDTVRILTINADDNLSLMKDLGFNTLPYLMLYQKGQLLDKYSGEMTRSEMEAWIRKYYMP